MEGEIADGWDFFFFFFFFLPSKEGSGGENGVHLERVKDSRFALHASLIDRIKKTVLK